MFCDSKILKENKMKIKFLKEKNVKHNKKKQYQMIVYNICILQISCRLFDMTLQIRCYINDMSML